MSDHADRLRDILELTDCSRGQWEPLLDALVAERDALQAFKDEALQTDWIARAEAAEARVTELEAERSEILRNSEIERKALQAERDEARRLYDAALRDHVTLIHQAEAAEAEVARLRALGEWAVTIISNVSEGDWTQEVDEWQDAARKWMDAFHARAALATPTKEGTDG